MAPTAEPSSVFSQPCGDPSHINPHSAAVETIARKYCREKQVIARTKENTPYLIHDKAIYATKASSKAETVNKKGAPAQSAVGKPGDSPVEPIGQDQSTRQAKLVSATKLRMEEAESVEDEWTMVNGQEIEDDGWVTVVKKQVDCDME